MKRLPILVVLLLLSLPALAKEASRGWCELGNQQVVTSGLKSTNKVQASFPLCIVTVYDHGTTNISQIYSDNLSPATPLANPFQANTNGSYIFYAANGRYDVVNSAGTPAFPVPYTYADVLLCDPFEPGSTCNSGGGGGATGDCSIFGMFVVTVNPPSNPTFVVCDFATIFFQHNGLLVGQEQVANFVDSTSTWTITDDPLNNRVNIEVAAVLPPASVVRHVCMMPVGSDNGAALVDADLGPQGRLCFIPAASTVIEVTVAADADVPQVIPGLNHAGSITNLVSVALATASAGGLACSNVGGTVGIDGATTCSATLQNTTVVAGDWFELVSGTAGGTAKRMSIAVTFTTP